MFADFQKILSTSNFRASHLLTALPCRLNHPTIDTAKNPGGRRSATLGIHSMCLTPKKINLQILNLFI